MNIFTKELFTFATVLDFYFMLSIAQRINAFAQLGSHIGAFLDGRLPDEKQEFIQNAVRQSILENPWFTEENIRLALLGVSSMLYEPLLEHWVKSYDLTRVDTPKTVAVVMAGNIPLVGFHDFLCVLVAGHCIKARLSSDDKVLLPALSRILLEYEPLFSNQIVFESGKLDAFDAVIATGSNNTARYFEYYFEKYPHIIRRNRNSVAILSGNESEADYQGLSKDIFMHFGLGCRNVTKVYFPEWLTPDDFIRRLPVPEGMIHHPKYANNYDYNKAVFLINRSPFYDSGSFLLREETAFTSPVSVIHFERYPDPAVLREQLSHAQTELQCVVADARIYPAVVPFGQAQFPQLHDYADGVDVIDFLIRF